VKDIPKRLAKSLHKKKEIMDAKNGKTDYNKIVLAVDSIVNTQTMSNKDFLERIFEGAFKLIPEAEKGSFYELIDDRYVPIVSSGYDIQTLQKLIFNREDAFADYQCSDIASIEAYEIYIEERDATKFSKEMIDIFKELGTYSNYICLYAPIQVEGLNIGLICFDCFNKTGFTKTSKQVLKFYAQIISNFYTQKIMHEREKKMYDEIVAALVSAIEVKDKYTEGHAQRVREYSCDIAEELQFSRPQIAELNTAALLHDIGKIGISTEILNKPGKLTEDEYNVIKLHPIHTKTILEKISGFSTIANLAYNHHENYDGTGYPRGLKCDEIPFGSQIIQVADAYDAMTSERAYRKALSSNQALEIIREEIGRQFNPKIAMAAIKIFSKL